ncbi:MAG: deoxyguanosinetriphosphate triphosphohydrolase [Micrococcales bacterium]
MESGYSAFDEERFLAEERRSSVRRSEFARDRARVLHSSALRRLGAKTQVLSPSGGDFARTRLTHSLEVAQIGREMAADLGISADLVDLACLAHDLGHPPFGHNGERALNEWAREFGGFEGNAQTFRLLTRIEPKVFSTNGVSLGLNLTRAALDATCKYPWSLAQASTDSGADRSVKFGVYTDDREIFDWMRLGASGRQKSVEAQIMDFADDVAYSVHDFEDAIVAGFVDLAVIADPSAQQELLSKISHWNGGVIAWDALTEALDNLRALEYWPSAYRGEFADLGTLKNLTSSLIGRFVSATTANSVAVAKGDQISRYHSVLAVPETVLAEISILKGLVSAFLMSHESRRPFYEWQRAILTELADALLAANGKNLDQYNQLAWTTAKSIEAQHRVIVDQIACLTDQSALSLHNQLVGRSA